MTNTNKTPRTADLIARSISHTEIAHAEWSSDLAADLSAECDDSVEASATEIEYWGTDEDGQEWRVHLLGDRAAAAPVHYVGRDEDGELVTADDVQ